MKEEKIPQLSFADYPPDERHMLAQLKDLFADWEKTLEDSDDQRIRENARDMTKDGFFPNYTRQPKKILFLGRDSYGMESCDYIDTFFDVYRRSKMIGSKESGHKSLNQHMFHARMLHVAWGILNGMPDWDMIPWAEKIGDDFGTENGISFAFMNLGKVRFRLDGTNADFPAIEAFCEASTQPRNFIAEQIAILKPDIIISMWLGHRLDYIGPRESLGHTHHVSSFRLTASGHNCLLLDCWHFASWRHSHKKNFYNPICDALREYQRRS